MAFMFPENITKQPVFSKSIWIFPRASAGTSVTYSFRFSGVISVIFLRISPETTPAPTSHTPFSFTLAVTSPSLFLTMNLLAVAVMVSSSRSMPALFSPDSSLPASVLS